MSDFEKIIFLADKIEPNMRPAEYRAEMFEMLAALGGIEKGQMTNRVFGLDRKLYKIMDDIEYKLS